MSAKSDEEALGKREAAGLCGKLEFENDHTFCMIRLLLLHCPSYARMPCDLV